MVAIAVVAVMTGGTSSTQNALETTLTREEIDTQAEALRFIHASYLADENTEDKPFTKLWDKIISNAYVPQLDVSENQKYQQYNPSTCQSIYDDGDGGVLSKAFVINPYKLASSDPSSAYIKYNNSDSDKFKQALTYPHLIFGEDVTNNTDNSSLASSVNSTDLFQAAGIFVIAVKDPDSTRVVGNTGKKATYYDFYIRTCWYSTGSDTPSTISTVIRLYDPKGIK